MYEEKIRETTKELQEKLDDLKGFFDVYFPSLYSLETNMDKIFELMIETDKSMSSYGDMTDAEIGEMLKEELDEVKKYIFKMTNKLQMLAQMFKINLEDKKIEIYSKDDIVALMERTNRLIDELVTEKMVELELIKNDFEDYNEMKPVGFLTGLLNHLTGFSECVSEVEGILEDELDFEIEDMDERLERLQNEKGLQIDF